MIGSHTRGRNDDSMGRQDHLEGDANAAGAKIAASGTTRTTRTKAINAVDFVNMPRLWDAGNLGAHRIHR